MKKSLLSLVFTSLCLLVFGQNPGDTIRVSSFTFDNPSRDLMVNFPDDPNLTYEKVLLKYSMRCKGGLVSTGTQPDLGCGQWDFSNNTYVVDSTKVWEDPRTIASHLITNFEGNEFIFSETPVYDFERSVETVITSVPTGSLNEPISIGAGSISLDRMLATNNVAGRSFYLYTAAELQAAGAVAGNIDGMEFMGETGSNGDAGFFRINMKHSAKEELGGELESDGFQEVYHNNQSFDGFNNFVFNDPFVWDGVSNILVEFSFTNLLTSNLSPTVIVGEETSAPMGMTSINEQNFFLTNNTYIECDAYKGVEGAQNRTVEAWIRTSELNSNGEIAAWGNASTSEKFTFRLTNGRLRVEVSGGGTEGTARLDDGEWHHVVAVLNGSNVGNIRFYVDGQLDPNSVVGNTAINTGNGTNVRITRGLNDRYLEGNIDDVRIWDTALSEETIDKWKRLDIDASHPNFSNLQLNYEFSGTGSTIIDASPNQRNARVIGNEFRMSESNGATLFKDFVLQNNRPNLGFFQGFTGQPVTEQVVLDRPIVKEPRHFVAARSIETTDPSLPFDDIILTAQAVELWTVDSKIFDADTGALIEETNVAQDGVIDIIDLNYMRRFPWFNELVSFVTPYGIGLDLGDGVSWIMDVSDYMPLLRGNKRMQMTLGGQNQEEMDLEFWFIVGTPPRDILQFDQVWQGTNQTGIATIAQIADDSKLERTNVSLSSEPAVFSLKSSITGHGSEGEFAQNGGIVNHMIALDEGVLYEWGITQECSLNPVFPQGGTWVFDREGWCPGEQSLIKINDLTPFVEAGETISIEYSNSGPPVPTGDYRYHMAHQIVGYGEANFQMDAAIIEIAAPNNGVEFRRVGEICANPIITIRNTGANNLTSLNIQYWINDSQNPQTFEWTGDLEFMEDEEVVIPSTRDLWFDILDEGNQFHVAIDSPNQSSDGYVHNNTMTSNFDVPLLLPTKITVEMRTNNVPSDNSYQLLDAAGNVIGSNSLPIANTTYRDDYELTGDCFTLRVNDVSGDGLEWFANPGQGVGSASIKDEIGIALVAFETDFGGGFDFRFTTDFQVSVAELEFLTSIKMFPNPSSDRVTIEANDLSNTTVYLTDVLGRNVPSFILNQTDNSISFNVQRLDTGIYFVVLKQDDIVTTRKLVIE